MPSSPFPARLHVLLARDAPYGVVIRRGPSKRVCTIGWNREDDTFTLGQWMKGRIYEDSCDISPDGRHLIYCAMTGTWRTEIYNWTTISLAPYLKATGFVAEFGRWGGGGYFVDNNTYCVTAGFGAEPLYLPIDLRPLHFDVTPKEFSSKAPSPARNILVGHGWTIKDHAVSAGELTASVMEKCHTQQWVLLKRRERAGKRQKGKSSVFDSYDLENPRTGQKLDASAWEWADFDRHRIVWTQQGKLFARDITGDEIGEPIELYDFNPMKFEAIKAPY